MFVGHVLAAGERINVLTGHAFYWALVETLGGAYDVMIDPELLPSVPAAGGVLSGSFWLSGRIIARCHTRARNERLLLLGRGSREP
jgi:hypothetical protein